MDGPLLTGSRWEGASSALPKGAKVIHFIRHGEGVHNVAAREGGPEQYKNWDWHDSRLTDKGKGQAASLQPAVETIPVEVVYVSPLSRAIVTGLLAFEKKSVPFVCTEDIRERIGTHPCDKRRSVAELTADFPKVDFAALTTPEDPYWTEAREPWDDMVLRADRFVTNVWDGPHTHVGCVAHNDFFQALFGRGAWDIPADLRSIMFDNCDLHSIVIAPKLLSPTGVASVMP